MGSLEDAIRRSNVMSGIENIISQTINSGPLCTVLGTDLVGDIERHKVNIDVTFQSDYTYYRLTREFWRSWEFHNPFVIGSDEMCNC